ncbi:MAG: porin [Planctomycetota bacterium]|nr:porin [Planctomycetota bacterium]
MRQLTLTAILAAMLACPVVAQDLDWDFHGRINGDWSSFSPSNGLRSRVGDFDEGSEWRRIRFGITGTAWHWLGFRARFDYDPKVNELEINSLWLQVEELLPVGRFRVGYLKEPFGLERQASSRALLFMERSSAAALTTNRNLGFTVSDASLDQLATWSAGLFRETHIAPGGQQPLIGNAHHFTARATLLPVFKNFGAELLHIGAAFSKREAEGGVADLNEGMQLHMSPTLVATGLLAADDIQKVGIEAAFVRGPWSMQGEWLLTSIEQPNAAKLDFPGFYLQASCFLTDTFRRYHRRTARFQQPDQEALEIAARFSKLDLQSGAVRGGVMTSNSVALNWYLSAHTKIQFDFEQTRLESFGNVNGFAMRFEYSW